MWNACFRPLEEVVAKKTKQQWDPDHQNIISPLSTPASGSLSKRKRCIVDDPMDFVDVNRLSSWNLHDLTAAGKLLRRPPLPCQFDDEHEMRRVYSMIYDVYRCKWDRCIIWNGRLNDWFAIRCTITFDSFGFVHSCLLGFDFPINFETKGLLWHRLEPWFLCVISQIDMPFDLIANFKSVRDKSFAIDFIAERHETVTKSRYLSLLLVCAAEWIASIWPEWKNDDDDDDMHLISNTIPIEASWK